VVDLAQIAVRQDGQFPAESQEIAENRAGHVGYYLIDAGRPNLDKALGYQPPLTGRTRQWIGSHPALVYFGSISILVLGIVLGMASFLPVSRPVAAIVLGVTLLIPAITAAVSVVNWALTYLLKPRVLPKMDFSEGIPPAYDRRRHPAMLTIPK
jgi:cyclic beta-1,2-glucan synthetase